MKIYLDVCCLNRPFDDQTQDRMRLETEAIDVFLTTDDKLIRKANHLAGQLNVVVDNPLSWLSGQRETK
ncbi:hypothetical protein [Candidatus Leptofilum sp.]|uniref:hypothetical protein n=1 Tax=Candidatus Leptofilum sp. TaxID=3241576 RepID=UPI003B5A8FEE